jgi:hypothetical protein
LWHDDFAPISKVVNYDKEPKKTHLEDFIKLHLVNTKWKEVIDETKKWVAYYFANKDYHLHKENEWVPSLECFTLNFKKNIQ